MSLAFGVKKWAARVSGMVTLGMGLVLASVSVSHAAGSGQGFSAFDEESKRIIEELGNLVGVAQYPERHKLNEFPESFQYVRNFIGKVSHADLSDDEKVKLIAPVATAWGETIIRITEPFVDVEEATAPPKYSTGFQRAMYIAAERGRVILSQLSRDFTRIPETLPWIGKDRTRSVIAKQAVKHLDQEIQKLLAVPSSEKSSKEVLTDVSKLDVADQWVLAAMIRALDRMGRSEPVRWGGTNRWVQRLYLGLAAFFLIDPPMVFTFQPDYTYQQLITSGLIWMKALATLAHSRQYNSALGFFRIYERLSQQVASLRGGLAPACQELLRGSSRDFETPAEAYGSVPSVRRRR